MLVSYALPRKDWAALVFAVSWTLGASFLFIEGVWPIAAIQATFAVVAYRRWWKLRASN
jgi:hypothetical protein